MSATYIMVSGEVRSRILDLGKEKKSVRTIAAELGISKSVVGAVLKGNRVSFADEKPTVSEEPKVTPEPRTEAVPTMSISDEAASEFLSAVNASAPPIKPSPAEVRAEKAAMAETVKREVFLENLLGNIAKPPADEELPVVRMPKKRSGARRNKTPPMFIELPADDPAANAALISQITMNVNSFEPLLRDLLRPNKDSFLSALQKKSHGELLTTLKIIEHTRTVGNVSNQLKHFLYMGAMGVEMGAKKFLKMKTDGFALALRTQDEEIKMILKEMCMDKVEQFQKIQRPELRLASLMAMTLLAVHSQNSLKDNGQYQQEEAVAPENTEKYADL